jgi:ATP-dependent Lon protease
MKGKGGLTLTGSLGDVMKESAQAALSYARAHAKELDIDPKIFGENDFHIHIPEGAIPKDGPSAGVTMATVLLSVCTDRMIKWDVAMTGEITLRGIILPVGGIKEKVLAAQRAGVKRMIMPLPNKKDLIDIPKNVLREMEFIFVENIRDVFKNAMIAPPKPGPSTGAAASEKSLRRRSIQSRAKT